MSKQNINKETQTIKAIALANGYGETMVDNLVRKQRLKMKKHKYNINEKTEQKYVALSYINKNTQLIANLLKRKYNITAAFSTKQAIGKQVHNNNIETRDIYNCSGVYKLQCQEHNCKSSYVGQTGRTFHIRYKEHRKGQQNRRPTAFSEHIYEHNHSFTNIKDDMNIVHLAQKSIALNTYEAIESFQDRTQNYDNLNDHTLEKHNVMFSLLTHPNLK